jgi:hypothetical protein
MARADSPPSSEFGTSLTRLSVFGKAKIENGEMEACYEGIDVGNYIQNSNS